MAALSDATVTVAVRLFSSESNAISPKHSPLLYERTFSLQSAIDQSNISRQANQPAIASRSKGQHRMSSAALLIDRFNRAGSVILREESIIARTDLAWGREYYTLNPIISIRILSPKGTLAGCCAKKVQEHRYIYIISYY